MTVQTKATLKTYFQTGDKPTQSNFEDLIDTFVTEASAVQGTGTVTSAGFAGLNGIDVTGSPITTSGVITIGLSAIAPTRITTGLVSATSITVNGDIVASAATFRGIVSADSGIRTTTVSASGTLHGSNLSGTNTGDQTITLTGDVSGSGTGSFAATVTRIQGAQISAGTPASGEVLTYVSDNKWSPRTPSNSGTVTSVSAGRGLTASPNPITASGSIEIATTGVSAGRYTLAQIDVNALGQITSAANGSVAGTTTSLTTTAPFTKVSNTALSNITGLTATLTTGTYNFIANLSFDTASGPGAKISFDFTGTASSYYANSLLGLSTSNSVFHNTSTVLGNSLGPGDSTVVAWGSLRGSIVVTSAGTFGVQFAQQISSPTTAAVLTNSSLVIFRN
jgi:hypothetical protein